MTAILDYAPPQRRRLRFLRVARYLPLPLFWLDSLLPLLAPCLSLLAFLLMLVLLIRRRFLLAAIPLLLSPIAFNFARGVSDYIAGTGTLEGRGLMVGASRVDPETRLTFTSGGCLVRGNEWMTDGAHNAGLRLCISLFGYMRGSYDGPFPDEPTAFAFASSGAAFDLRQLATDTFAVDGVRVSLRPGSGAKLLAGFHEGPACDPADASLIRLYGEAHARVYAGWLLLLQIPKHFPDGNPARESGILLIDIPTGRLVSTYGVYFLRTGWRR